MKRNLSQCSIPAKTLPSLTKQDSKYSTPEDSSAAWAGQKEQGKNELQTKAPLEDVAYK